MAENETGEELSSPVSVCPVFSYLESKSRIFRPMEKSCTFCQIIRGENPTDFLYQDETLAVFKDIHPHAPVHLLIVPKKHIRSLNDLMEEDGEVISKMIFRAREMAKGASIDRSGYKLLFNVERGGGQVIFHLHMHLIGGW